MRRPGLDGVGRRRRSTHPGLGEEAMGDHHHDADDGSPGTPTGSPDDRPCGPTAHPSVDNASPGIDSDHHHGTAAASGVAGVGRCGVEAVRC